MTLIEYYQQTLERQTTIGNPNLLDEENLVNEKPFNPQLWEESGYSARHGQEYIGPATADDLGRLREHLNSKIETLEPLSGVAFDLEGMGSGAKVLTGTAIVDFVRSYLKNGAPLYGSAALVAQSASSIALGAKQDKEALLIIAEIWEEQLRGHRQVIGVPGSESQGARSQAAFNSRVISSQIQWASARV